MALTNLQSQINGNQVKLSWSDTDSVNTANYNIDISSDKNTSIFFESTNRPLTLPNNIFIKNTKYFWRVRVITTPPASILPFTDYEEFIYTGQTAEDLCTPMWPDNYILDDIQFPDEFWPDCDDDELADDDTELCKVVFRNINLISKINRETDLKSNVNITTNLIGQVRNISDLKRDVIVRDPNLINGISVDSNVISALSLRTDLLNNVSADSNLIGSVVITPNFVTVFGNNILVSNAIFDDINLIHELGFETNLCKDC